MSSSQQLFDAAGRRRSPATMPGHHARKGTEEQRPEVSGRSTDRVDEIVAVMREAGEDRHGRRLRALIIVLWRAGLRIQEALALTETDLDERRGSVLIRRGKNDKRREIGMDAWAWSTLAPWITERTDLPVGPLFCVIDGPTRGRAWSASGVRVELRRVARDAGVRRRFAPHH